MGLSSVDSSLREGRKGERKNDASRKDSKDSHYLHFDDIVDLFELDFQHGPPG